MVRSFFNSLLMSCSCVIFIVISYVFPFFCPAGVSALVILISHADQINDIIFSQEGVLKGCL